MSEHLIPGVFLDTDQATRLYNVCMGVVEMAETARTEDQIPMCTLAVFRRELLNLLEIGAFSFIDRSDFKKEAVKHLETQRARVDETIWEIKEEYT